MRIDYGRLDQARERGGELENHLVDEFLAGRVSRRDFLRRGTVIGMSLPLLGTILAACGSSPSSSGNTGTASGGSGGTVRVAINGPTGEINPLTVADIGGLDMLAQTGEYLCLSDQQLGLRPVLATSWKANSAADVWTFTIRKGVKFHNGASLTADDVVYTYQLQTNTKNASSALSAFNGGLKPSGVVKKDDYTVEFHLEAPNGNFPYLCSSDNYNMIILPKGSDPGKWQSTFVGTGPFVLSRFTEKQGASFARNNSYWGPKSLPAATEFTFYTAQAPQVTALLGGQVDVVGQFAVAGGEAVLNGNYNVIKLRSSAHRELSMRNDVAPFTDARVRQAVALTLDRPAIITALFKGYADLGNDSPFAPVYPSTSPVAQRKQDLQKAKSLLSAAGHPGGFTTDLITENFLEIPQYAQIIVESAKQAGIHINLKVESQGQYYGKATYGNSDWLDATMSLVDYGHRSVPNVFLSSTLESSGTWNAAHFKNSTYDHLAAQYIAATDLSTQRSLSKQIETLLLNETPIIYAYFYNFLTATAKNVTGVYPTAVGHVFLQNTKKS